MNMELLRWRDVVWSGCTPTFDAWSTDITSANRNFSEFMSGGECTYLGDVGPGPGFEEDPSIPTSPLRRMIVAQLICSNEFLAKTPCEDNPAGDRFVLSCNVQRALPPTYVTPFYVSVYWQVISFDPSPFDLVMRVGLYHAANADLGDHWMELEVRFTCVP